MTDLTEWLPEVTNPQDIVDFHEDCVGFDCEKCEAGEDYPPCVQAMVARYKELTGKVIWEEDV